MFDKIKINLILFCICVLFLQALPAMADVILIRQDVSDKAFQLKKKSTVFREAERTVSIIDPTIFTNPSAKIYPGLRGGNQLVIYTPKFGMRTATNEYGSEAVVIDGIVVQVNGADSVIPANGFVISGHGSAKRWINENITVGTQIEFDEENKKIRAYITPDSYVYNAKQKIKEVQKILHDNDAMNIYYDDRKANYYIKKSKEYIARAKKDERNIQKYSSLAIIAADKALEHSIPYSKNELKGVWVRPTETDVVKIGQTLDKMQNAGISDVFLETYFHGTTIYPSEVLKRYNVYNQKAEFNGFDPLKAWIDGAHKRNMKVHIWFETFYVGNKYSEYDSKHVLNVYKNWRNTTKKRHHSDIPCSSPSEHNGYFLDPANPEVQAYLLEILKEIIVKYKPDGINLDYIRYPQSLISKYSGYEDSNWGYTEYARQEFKHQYNHDPIDLKFPSKEWELWALYRQEKITEFVKKAKMLTLGKNIELTAVVFPDRVRSLETKMQDWSMWSRMNIVDGLTPLILTCDKHTATVLINDILQNVTPFTNIYAGFFVPFMGGQSNDLLRQIHANRILKNEGVILFDYAHLDDKYVNALTTSVFNSGKTRVKREIIFPDYEFAKDKSRKNERNFSIFERK